MNTFEKMHSCEIYNPYDEEVFNEQIWSIVTKDIPENVVAVGNLCKVLRKIDEKDKEYYFKNRKINWNELNI